MDSFLIKYKQWSKQHGYQFAKVVAPKYYTFENEEAINVGGTIKSISFDASLFKSARSITIVGIKQVLFSVSIDDVYQKGSDFLKNINSNELRAKCLYKASILLLSLKRCTMANPLICALFAKINKVQSSILESI